MKTKILYLTLLLFSSLIATDIITPTKHNKNLTLKDIAEIQPGLGTIMVEFGHRFYTLYYASKGGNWELAKYQLHEMIEASEVAEITRPKYKKQLKEFEDTYLSKLKKTIKQKDFKNFKKAYTQTTISCNNCHKINGHNYIRYKLPKNPPIYLDMTK